MKILNLHHKINGNNWDIMLKGSDKMEANKGKNPQWYPGHMAKTKREVSEKIDLIDVVIEIIDSRIPLSSKNKDIDNLIKNKPRILVMTKKDLCDLNKTLEWKKYYEELGYNVILIDLLKDNTNEIINVISKYNKELNEKRKLKGLKDRKIRVLVLGIPNVGKSTLINRLVNKKATNVGNKPGITKNLQWIRVNNDIELLDTPGILWPKLDNYDISHNLASMTAIKEEILDKEEIAIYIIEKMLKYYPDNIKSRYNLSNEEDIVDILDSIGKKIGAFRNGETDYEKVYQVVMKDLKDGYLGQVTFDWRDE